MNLSQYAIYLIGVGINAMMLRVPAWAFYLAVCVGLMSFVTTVFKGEEDDS